MACPKQVTGLAGTQEAGSPEGESCPSCAPAQRPQSPGHTIGARGYRAGSGVPCFAHTSFLLPPEAACVQAVTSHPRGGGRERRSHASWRSLVGLVPVRESSFFPCGRDQVSLAGSPASLLPARGVHAPSPWARLVVSADRFLQSQPQCRVQQG